MGEINNNLVDVIDDNVKVKMCTATDAANKLEISLDEVIKLIEKGELPAIKKGNKYVIKEKDIKAYKEKDRKKLIRMLSIGAVIALVMTVVFLLVLML